MHLDAFFLPEKKYFSFRWMVMSFKPAITALLATSRFLTYHLQPRIHGSTHILDVEKHYAALLRTAARSRAISDGKAIHCYILKTIPLPSLFLSNSLASMYCKCRSLPRALQVFDEIPHPDVVSWNTIVGGCFLSGLQSGALALFREMLRCGVAPDEFSFAGVLKSCDLGMGFSAHCVAIKRGIGDSAFVANGLVEFYADFSLSSDVVKVFESVERKDIALINAVIGKHSKAGNFQVAFALFSHHVLGSHLLPDRSTFVSLLSGIDRVEFWRQGVQAHCLIVKLGLEEDGAVQNSLVKLYCSYGCTDDAHDLLQYSISRNLISWTSLMNGYADQEQFRHGLDVFCQIYHDGMLLDDVLLACILSIAAASQCLQLGIQLHSTAIKHGFEWDYCVHHALMDMYFKCMCVQDASKVFQLIGEGRNLLSWTILISGYAKCGFPWEALERFSRMNMEGIAADSVACTSVLIACSDLQAADQGEQIHAFLIKSGNETDNSVQTALLSLYSQCGNLNEAVRMFQAMDVHDTVSWTALISAYVNLGCMEQALLRFNQMVTGGTKPNCFTLVSALTASAKLASALTGKSIHAAAIKTGLEEDTFLGGALIDMYCKCGDMDSAVSYFYRSSKHDIILWNPVLAGHAQHGNVLELLEAYKEMLAQGIEPDTSTFLSLLSGCSHGGLVNKVVQLFASMRDEYGIRPQMEHHACVVGALARAGFLRDAVTFVEGIGVHPGSTVLRTLISFCIVHGHVKLGLASMAKMVLLGRIDGSAFVLLSNLYATQEKWLDRRKVREAMEVEAMKLKEVGMSWII